MAEGKTKVEKWEAFDKEAWEVAGPPIKLIGLLSFYDENPAWLAAAIASLSKIGIDHVVALDGAYQLFPGGKASSAPEQHEAIVQTCAGLGCGLTLHVPSRVWAGNEVEKRSKMFEIAESFAEPDHDWYVVIDADETVKYAPSDLRNRLLHSEHDAASVLFWNREQPRTEQERQFHWEPISKVEIPILFRAVPELRVIGTHFTYKAGDGRILWGLGDDKSSGLVEDFHDLTDCFVIDHRSAFRGKVRADAQKRYYQLREASKIEQPDCCRCDREPDVLVHTNFSRGKDGELLGQSVHACQEHADEIEAESLAQLADLGVDPTKIDWGSFSVAT